jgi:hypothetical protein
MSAINAKINGTLTCNGPLYATATEISGPSVCDYLKTMTSSGLQIFIGYSADDNQVISYEGNFATSGNVYSIAVISNLGQAYFVMSPNQIIDVNSDVWSPTITVGTGSATSTVESATFITVGGKTSFSASINFTNVATAATILAFVLPLPTNGTLDNVACGSCNASALSASGAIVGTNVTTGIASGSPSSINIIIKTVVDLTSTASINFAVSGIYY